MLRILQVPGVSYVHGDLEAAWSANVLDVTDLHQFSDETFDAVICNHVLEHVPDDRRAMAEIRRVLKPDGWALLLVPDVVYQDTDEDSTVDTAAERVSRFGQADHVRNYGWDYVDRLAEQGFAVAVEDQAALFDTQTIERCRLEKLGALEPLFLVRRATDSTQPAVTHPAALAAVKRPAREVLTQ